MIHIMKLKDKYFDCIKYGKKSYEICLNDEKRRKIKIGDFIEFQKEPYLEDKIIVRVDDLLYYSNFNALLNDLNIELLAPYSISIEKFSINLESFYPIEKQRKYGVVAIKINKNIIINNSNINNVTFDKKLIDILKSNYANFLDWFNIMKANNVNIYYTMKDNNLSSIMILKIFEDDSQQFLEKGNILKIRTLLVTDKKKGIGSMYLNIIDDIAASNNIDYIYLTLKKDNKELISFIEKKLIRSIVIMMMN